MKAFLIAFIAFLSTSAMADRICGTVKNVSPADADIIIFSLSVAGEDGWRLITVLPKDAERIRPLVLTALSNPNIRVCTQLSDELKFAYKNVSFSRHLVIGTKGPR